MRTHLLILMLISASSCIPTTGGNQVSFSLSASGGARTFTANGFEVELTTAQLFIGAVYFNQTNPATYALESGCYSPGIYTGEVRAPLTVDALDTREQRFPADALGTDLETRAAELWLTSGDVNADDDNTEVLSISGTARRGTEVFPFEGHLTIGTNRKVPPRNEALPGSSPPCRQRIIAPIPFTTTFTQGASVRLRIEPARWFQSVDFSKLTPSASGPGTFVFVDDLSVATEADTALMNGLRSAIGPYRFE